MGTSGWSTQQLAEFVAAVSAADSEAAAAIVAVERAAEALDADVAAIVADGELVAVIGYPNGAAPVAELEAVQPGLDQSFLDVPGVGACSAAAAPLEHPPGARLAIARQAPNGLTREEAALLRGMARVASMTMRMLRVLDNERVAHEELERLAHDQAALGRVATLVAEAAPRGRIYAAVAAEIAQLLGADVAAILHYEADETATILGGWSRTGPDIPIGDRLTVAGEGVVASVLRDARPARVERFDGPRGSVAGYFGGLGVRTGVGSPIVVENDLWGVAFAASAEREALPDGTEARIAQFTELVATAIANAEGRAELRRVADEQAALRRVATLVARGAPAEEVLGAVASETRAVLDSDISTLLRLEPDGMITVMATEGTLAPVVSVGERHKPLPGGAVERALQTGRTARTDGYEGQPGSMGEHLRALGYGGSASAPIFVADRLWGVISVIWAEGRSMPPGGEDRLMQFGELIATALANAEARADLRQVAEEQAALRRVATRVARGEPPSAVLAAVAVEAGHVIPAADVALVGRYDSDDAIEFVGGWSRDDDPGFVGDRVALGGHNVSTLVFKGNQPARCDYIPDDSTPASALARKWARSSAGAPITVEGRLWGVMIVGAADEQALPAGTEHRLAQFTELVATAIGNAEAREELRRVADDQAALRRVATLVARAAPSAEVFAAVAAEVGRLLPVEGAGVLRYDGDGSATVVGGWSGTGDPPRLGLTVPLGGHNAVTRVFETGRPARIEYAADDSNPATAQGREAGGRAAIGAPIGVAGRLWGAVVLVTQGEDTLTTETETRLVAFTELVATAIANAQAREELRRVADDQAALRRVATLVAHGAPADKIFDAVTDEIHRLLDADQTGLSRYDPDGLWTVLASRGAVTDMMPIGFRLDPGPSMPGVAELLSGRSVRVDGPPSKTTVDDLIRVEQLQAWVASPIVLMGQTWGQVAVFSRSGPLPAGTEERLGDFTELIATAIANATARAEVRQVADQQAALRRVATLVAAAAPPAEVFAGVAEEVGRLLSADRAYVSHYDTDDIVTVLAGWTPTGEKPPGLHQQLRGELSIRVRETGRSERVSARVDRALPGGLGNRSAVAAPITVEGRLWGLMGVAWTSEEQPPPETEERLTEFTELIATAIANAQAREDLRRVAHEQAALRRVATLVAAAAPPAEVFASVAEEVGRLLQVDRAFVARYEADQSVSIVAGWSSTGAILPVGARGPVDEGSVSDLVRNTGAAARIDALPDYPDYPGDLPAAVGMRSAVGVPILVDNRLWGLVATGSGGDEPPSPETEARLIKFTELVGTAIANANVRDELTASRARLVASADQARRKIERDLHDGAQAQLVTLALQVRAAQALLAADDPLEAELERVATGLNGALEELRELASGIHPPILAAGGLGAAVRTLGRRSRIPVDVAVRTVGRLPQPVEVAAYYVVSEALTNAVKHSQATSVTVEIEAADNVLRIGVQDDGVGGAEFARGSGLVGLRDRVEALGGRIALQSTPGLGTSLSVELPLSPDPAALASR